MRLSEIEAGSEACEYAGIPEYNGMTCSDLYDCCSCGGNDCGCAYCFDCNACEFCLNEE